MAKTWVLVALLLQAGAKPVPPAMHLPAADIEAALKDAIAQKRTDVPIRTIDAGEHNIEVAIVYMDKAMAGSATSHDKVTEMYHMIEGAGTYVSGGTLVNSRAMNTSIAGPSLSGDSIRGGVSRRVVKGDVIVIPPGTPHQWMEITAPLTYLDIRVDPSRVLTPLGDRRLK